MNKSYIWSLPTRLFHWLFAGFILLAFITGDEDSLLTYHAILGYALFILLTFRVSWGYVGPKFSKFRDFPLSVKDVKEFLLNIFSSEQKYVGHNPAASFVMVAMFVVCFLTIATGVLAFGIQEGKGVFSFLNDSVFKKMKLFKEIHEVLSTLFIVLIVAHIGGVLSDKLLHPKHETLNSIVTGFKVTNENHSIKLNIFQKGFALIMLIVFIAFLVFSFIEPKNILLASKYESIDYKKQNELFVSECASCHTLYPSQSFT